MEVKEEEEEEVWSWGAGTDGQLGTGIPVDQHLPQLVSSLSAVSFLACGGAHVIALTPGKKVMTWGRGTSGQLGHGDMLNCLQPKPVEFFNSFDIIHASAGWNHSGFVSETGCLFTCGDGTFGQLGLGHYTSQFLPVKVSYFDSRHVEQIAFGMRHSLALLKGQPGDQVYGFGSGKRGQLGISNNKVKSISLPEVTSGLGNVDVVSISANGDHSAALSVDGHMYTWGKGLNSSSDATHPHRVAGPWSFTKVALGWNHALALTGEGEVLMLGGRHHGVLSNPQRTNLVKNKSQSAEESTEGYLQRPSGLEGITVVDVAAGAEHSALTTDNGEVMTWGWGEHGQLGLGNTADYRAPQVVTLNEKLAMHEHVILKVYCGSGFTFVTRTKRTRC